MLLSYQKKTFSRPLAKASMPINVPSKEKNMQSKYMFRMVDDDIESSIWRHRAGRAGSFNNAMLFFGAIIDDLRIDVPIRIAYWLYMQCTRL